MYRANDEQNHLAKYIKKFKTKRKPQNISNFKKVKEGVINSTMALLKGSELVFKVFERLKESEQSEQSSDDVKYNEFGYETYWKIFQVIQKIQKITYSKEKDLKY